MSERGAPTNASEPALRLSAVRRVHGEGEAARAALDGVSLTIAQGSFVAVVGASGSGKSTLLSVMGALDRDYQGRVEVLGRDLRTLDERVLGQLRNTQIGFVFQSFHLLPHLTVLDNVASPALFGDGRDGRSGDGRDEARRRLGEVGLADRADDRPQHLSGGQRQRVALARALLHNPRILLCDEPTGNLDSGTGAEVIELLARLPREHGTTVVVVTHEERLAARAERQITLRDGRVAHDSAPVGEDAKRGSA